VAGKEHQLFRELRAAGISRAAIEAAWPSWWDESLRDEPSGEAELRFALSRRLGLSAPSLIGERVEFTWNNEAFFKHLSAKDEAQRAAITSFGMSIARLLIRATPQGADMEGLEALELRDAILEDRQSVDLTSILGTCWALGVPVIQLAIFPTEAKSMHAMVVRHEGRHAILMARSARYSAQVAFTLAHEVGHAALGHLAQAPALVDMEDPASHGSEDEQELEADRFALALLTGRPEPNIQIEGARLTVRGLAKAAATAGPAHRIEPGTLALCVGYQQKEWKAAIGALRVLEPEPADPGPLINRIAADQLEWDALGDDAADWLRTVLGQ
jgi:Zn-dependent peptidase ImmA (M78 family)